jgi:transcription elongation factor Elf1
MSRPTKTSKQSPPAPVLETTLAEPDDRMMRYQRNPRCPACDAHPVVCTMRRRQYTAFRCRQCGFRFSTGEVTVKEVPILWRRFSL